MKSNCDHCWLFRDGLQEPGRAEIAEGATLCVLEALLNLARFPRLQLCGSAAEWLKVKAKLGLAENTLVAYARGLEDFFSHCEAHSIDLLKAGRAEVAAYVQRLLESTGQAARGLSNSTAQQRLTSVRLFFDFLAEKGTGFKKSSWPRTGSIPKSGRSRLLE